MDPGKNIKHRLYRHHTIAEQGNYIKDLSLLGRDIKKTIIIDNNPENFKRHPENGIFIKSWMGDENDMALTLLFPILKSKQFLTAEIRLMAVEDVRTVLKELRETMDSRK